MRDAAFWVSAEGIAAFKKIHGAYVVPKPIPTGSNGCCLACGSWTPWEHREAHEHAENCKAVRRRQEDKASEVLYLTTAAKAAPALAAEVERLRGENERLAGLLGRARGYVGEALTECRGELAYYSLDLRFGEILADIDAALAAMGK